MDVLIDPFEPAYAELHRRGTLDAKAARAREVLEDCGGCPRQCAVNRAAGETGVCSG